MEKELEKELGLEKEFIEQFMDSKESPCPCNNPSCKTVRYEKKGRLLDYYISYDPSPKELETNIYIEQILPPMYPGKENPVVFNGRCTSNMDFAKVLNMVIL